MWTGPVDVSWTPGGPSPCPGTGRGWTGRRGVDRPEDGDRYFRLREDFPQPVLLLLTGSGPTRVSLSVCTVHWVS